MVPPAPLGMTHAQARLLEQSMPSILRIFQRLEKRLHIPPTALLVVVADARSGLGLAFGRMRWRHDALIRRVARQVARGRLPAHVVPLWGAVRRSFLSKLLPGEAGFIASRPTDATVFLVVDHESHGAIGFLRPAPRAAPRVRAAAEENGGNECPEGSNPPCTSAD